MEEALASNPSPPGARAPRARLLTWANALTGLRLALAPCLAAAILGGRTGLALALFVAACASDFADGGLARRFGQTSQLGGLLDHATDATFVVMGLAALWARGIVPAALPVLVAAAFLQYALDSRALAGAPLRPSALGRWNGIAYYVVVAIPVVRDALGLAQPGEALVRALGWVLVASTALSMAERLRSWLSVPPPDPRGP